MSVLEIQQDSRRETIAAAVASVLIHLLIIAGIALSMLVSAWQFPVSKAPEETPIEVTMISSAPPKPAEPAYVRTTPQNIPDAPKNAAFESDNNTRAASEAAPTGSQPLPSVDGRDSTTLELQNRKYSDGKPSEPAQPSPEVAKESAEPAPTPAPAAPASTPTTQFALREAPKPDPAKSQAKTQPPRPQSQAAQPKSPASAGFQPETRITRIRGNISNRGRASVDAAATPIGRYKKMVSDAIGSRWYYYVNNQIGLLNIGTVDIRFQVGPDGKAQKIKILSNTSNESFASVSISSIVEAEIPPIPPDVAKLLDNGRLEIDYSFTILTN
jgi:outer membrane biosynthesis protein TonB